MEHGKALAIAESLIDRLRPYCERIEIAGSVRRGKPDVKDIELVAVPCFIRQVDLFGQVLSNTSALDTVDWSKFGDWIKGGHKYKQIALHEGLNLDLFIVIAPAQWGVQFVIRTGPADFSHWIVTQKRLGGALPSYARVHDGAVWNGDAGIPMPEELDFLNFCGLGWIEPAQRRSGLQGASAPARAVMATRPREGR